MSCFIYSNLIATICFGLYFLRRYLQGKQFDKSYVRIDNKVVIVTGCNTGIGKETVLELAKRGGRIYMACRDYQRCETARLEIVEKSGNQNVFNRTLDLSSLKSVREFVDKFQKEENRLDILINNAAVIPQTRTISTDGYELQFATNHLGPFLLTNLLLDTMKKSSPARIVNVSSMAHGRGRIDKDDLMSEKSYSMIGTYSNTKVANNLFTRQLANKILKGSGVTANSLHPGVVKTDIFRDVPIYWYIFYPFYFLFKTTKSGAQTTLTVALDPELQTVTGKYFDDCKIAEEFPQGKDDEMADWLWRQSEKLSGLVK